jgi:two-component system, response regulator YcbB
MENTFLIIDDDENIRKMLTLIIKKNNLGKVITELDSGKDAVEEILFYNADIILIDLLLPFNDGIEIVKASKLRGYLGKFIMISQVEDELMISRAYESGILFFISKPINPIEVMNVIKGVCYNIDLENSFALIKNAVFHIKPENKSNDKVNIEEQILNIFNEIGVVGTIGSNDLEKIIYRVFTFKMRHSSSYQLQTIYEEIVQEESGSENISVNKKALEQRIRRSIQKSLRMIAELGCEDYGNTIFIEYSSLLFDFKEVRQEMKYIEHSSEVRGKISVKKFIEGIISKLNHTKS